MSQAVKLTWTQPPLSIGPRFENYVVTRELRNVDGTTYEPPVTLATFPVVYDYVMNILSQTLEFEDDTPLFGSTYRYTVNAVDDQNNAIASNQQIVTLAGNQPVAPVLTLVQILPTPYTFVLAWTQPTFQDPNENTDHFEIWRSQDGAPFALVHTTADGTTLSYDDTAVVNTSVYKYYVIGVGSLGTNTDPSNQVGDNFVLLYDVNTYPGFPPAGTINCIEIDPVNRVLFLVASDHTANVFASHLQIWRIGNDLSLTLLQTYPITNIGEVSFTAFIDWATCYYGQSNKVYIGRSHGLSTWNYNPADGSLTLSKFTDLTPPGGRYGFNTAVVMHRATQDLYVLASGRNSDLQVWGLPFGGDHTGPVRTGRECYFNMVAKFDDTYFYVATSDGSQVTRNSVDDAGNVTLLSSYSTAGLFTTGLDDGDNVDCAVHGGYLYLEQTTTAAQPILQPTRRFPIIDNQGNLGPIEIGSWDFRGDFTFLLELCSPGWKNALTFGGQTWFIRGPDGNLDQLKRTA